MIIIQYRPENGGVWFYENGEPFCIVSDPHLARSWRAIADIGGPVMGHVVVNGRTITDFDAMSYELGKLIRGDL